MRSYDIPYVQNPSAPSLPSAKDIETLDLRTIVRNFLCGKSQGRVSECMKCPAPCIYGKRAIELAIPKPVDCASPKLVNNKTLLELARESVEKQRAADAKPQNTNEEKPKKKSKRMVVEDWYDKAYASENPLQWIMDTFGINERKARQKVYGYQHMHPEAKEKPLWEKKVKDESAKTVKPAEPERQRPVQPEEKTVTVPDTVEKITAEDNPFASVEDKLNFLMNKQEEYKSKYEQYLKLYNETKVKVDALCEALTILNEMN